MNNQRIAIIIGTRAEYIKMFPIMLELQEKGEDYYFIHTGQHNLYNLCNIFGTKRPDKILSQEPDTSSKFNTNESKAIRWSLGMILKIRRELNKLPNIKYVLYHGDTMSTGIAAIGSSRLLNWLKGYNSIHLEAGLRSWSVKEPFPEEIIRRIVTSLSDILIAPSELSKSNLKNRRNIITAGNTILDSVSHAIRIGKERNLKPFGEKFALVTVHRHENIKDKERLKKIIDIINSITIPTYFSLHDNTKKKLIEFGLYNRLENNPNINFVKNMDYVSFIYQMSECSLIVCDGGSMQEESLIFKKPCIILRNNTERQEGLNSNFQFLSKLNVMKSKEKIKEFLSADFEVKSLKNPYGEIGVSNKIVEELIKK